MLFDYIIGDKLNNYLQPRLNILIDNLTKDFDLIASKDKDDEWKRDHYRYTFTVSVQRIYKLLNTSLTGQKASGIKPSTKNELKILRDIIDEMILS